MKKLFCRLLACLVVLGACRKEDEVRATDSVLSQEISDAVTLDKADFILPQSNDLASIPQDPQNPLTAEKVQLGQLLFHETKLGGNPKVASGIYTYSCASCHHAEAGFQSGLAQGIGEGGIGFGLTGEGRVP